MSDLNNIIIEDGRAWQCMHDEKLAHSSNNMRDVEANGVFRNVVTYDDFEIAKRASYRTAITMEINDDFRRLQTIDNDSDEKHNSNCAHQRLQLVDERKQTVNNTVDVNQLFGVSALTNAETGIFEKVTSFNINNACGLDVITAVAIRLYGYEKAKNLINIVFPTKPPLHANGADDYLMRQLASTIFSEETFVVIGGLQSDHGNVITSMNGNIHGVKQIVGIWNASACSTTNVDGSVSNVGHWQYAYNDSSVQIRNVIDHFAMWSNSAASDSNRSAAAEMRLSVKAKRDLQVSDWDCGSCTLINTHLCNKCVICETDRNKDADDSEWHCLFCKHANNICIEKCDGCGFRL